MIRCFYCGRFMGNEDVAMSITYTPYGSRDDVEEPAERYIHWACWDRVHPNSGLSGVVAWIGPTDHRKAS